MSRLLTLLPLLLVAGCVSVDVTREERAAPQPSNTHAEAQALLWTDEAFSKMSAERGVAEAFAVYWALDGVMLPMNEPILKGRDEVIAHLQKGPKGAVLTWKPVAAHVARSCDLGYTYGTYEWRPPAGADLPTVQHGKYVTIWRKQLDGSWKIVLDGGNPSPTPTGQ